MSRKRSAGARDIRFTIHGMTILPVQPVKLPDDLTGQTNGKLDTDLLDSVPGGKLHHAAAAAWERMRSAALKDGISLMPTSSVDTYRPYAIQVRLFQQRYDRIPRQADMKIWQGVKYWLKPGYAMAASPGTSNHGWGLAVDVALDSAGKRLAWLRAHASIFGFSWEAQSEPWHIRYVRGWSAPVVVPPYRGPYRMGDRGPAVKAIQRGLGIPADGIYGRQTASAVREFKRKRPWLWPVTIVCGRQAYAAITKK